jgi:hypothetical protein
VRAPYDIAAKAKEHQRTAVTAWLERTYEQARSTGYL